jgi:hypothetical protein
LGNAAAAAQNRVKNVAYGDGKAEIGKYKAACTLKNKVQAAFYFNALF